MKHIKSGLILDDKWSELDTYPCNLCVEWITPSPGKSTHTSLGILGCFHQFFSRKKITDFYIDTLPGSSYLGAISIGLSVRFVKSSED